MLNFKGMRFPIEVCCGLHSLIRGVPTELPHLEKMMQERGVLVDHSSINRWAVRMLLLGELRTQLIYATKPYLTQIVVT